MKVFLTIALLAVTIPAFAEPRPQPSDESAAKSSMQRIEQMHPRTSAERQAAAESSKARKAALLQGLNDINLKLQAIEARQATLEGQLKAIQVSINEMAGMKK